MTDRIKTLLLYATGPSLWAPVAVDTVLRGLLRLQDDDSQPSQSHAKRIAARALRHRFHYQSLSYMQDWKDAFLSAPELDVEACNTINLVEFAQARRKIREYPLVVILHSVASDDLSLLRRTESWFKERNGTLLVLPGNEYALMPDKIGFLQEVEANFIGSQLPLDAANWLYADCDRSHILPAPHALNPEVYRADTTSTRPIDIGFVGALHPYFIGDLERTQVVRYFQDHGEELGLNCDIQTKRMPRTEWAQFLNQSKGIVGAESGTYFLERTDRTKNAVQMYLREHPNASFDDVYQKFFQGYLSSVSGKAISSRHFEPIGTKTCQILLEGRYNDILRPDEHYIALKKDFSNIEDVVGRFKDKDYRSAMVEETHEFVLENHTYQHRVQSLIRGMFAT